MGFLPWLGALGLALVALAIVCYWPLRFDVSGRARGEPDGRFVVAAAASLAFVSVTFVWARGIRPEFGCLLFGRKLRWTPRGQSSSKPRAAPRTEAAPRGKRRRLDPLGLALELLSQRRHLRLRYLVLDLDYGFRDPLLTGRLAAAISVLSGVLPAPVEIRHRPRWDFEDGWQVTLDGRAFVKPLLVLLDTSVYVVRAWLGHERHQDRRHRREPAQRRAGDFEERDDRGRTAAGG